MLLLFRKRPSVIEEIFSVTKNKTLEIYMEILAKKSRSLNHSNYNLFVSCVRIYAFASEKSKHLR